MALGPQGPTPPPAAPPGAGAPGVAAGPQGPPAGGVPPQIAAALAAAQAQQRDKAPSLMVDVAGSLPPSVQLLEAGISFFKKAVVSKEFIDNPVHQAGLRALIDDGTQLVDSISKIVIGADIPESPVAATSGADVGADAIPPPDDNAE